MKEIGEMWVRCHGLTILEVSYHVNENTVNLTKWVWTYLPATGAGKGGETELGANYERFGYGMVGPWWEGDHNQQNLQKRVDVFERSKKPYEFLKEEERLRKCSIIAYIGLSRPVFHGQGCKIWFDFLIVPFRE